MEQQFTPNLQDCVSMRSLMKAMWGCASQLWVPGRSCVPGSPFLNICPKNSATIQFQVLMSMQMDACFRKERIGTHFVWVGALEGGFGRRVVSQWCPPQKVDMPSKKTSKTSLLGYNSDNRFRLGLCINLVVSGVMFPLQTFRIISSRDSHLSVI
jgi:hypothetical protein